MTLRQLVVRVVFAILVTLISLSEVGKPETLHTETACLMAEDSIVVPASFGGEHYVSKDLRLRHWAKPVVRIALADETSPARRESLQRIIEQGARLWNEKSLDVVRLESVEANGDIVVRFVPASELPPRTLGKTTIQFRSASRTLSQAEVLLQQDLSEERLVQAVAHELGHALGIQGHSPNKDDLMFEQAHLPAAVTRRDANTLRISYGVFHK